MAKQQVIGNLKLRIPAGRATAGPPVGSTLGQWGLNMMDFINPFNEKTKDSKVKKPSATIMMTESVRTDQTDERGASYVTRTKQPDYNPYSRHGNSIITAWMDGHVTSPNVPSLVPEAIYNTPPYSKGGTAGDPDDHWDIY